MLSDVEAWRARWANLLLCGLSTATLWSKDLPTDCRSGLFVLAPCYLCRCVWSERVPNPLVLWIKIWRFSGALHDGLAASVLARRIEDNLREVARHRPSRTSLETCLYAALPVRLEQGQAGRPRFQARSRGLCSGSRNPPHVAPRHSAAEHVPVPHRVRSQLTRAVQRGRYGELACRSPVSVAQKVAVKITRHSPHVHGTVHGTLGTLGH
jgi:hypothetical protein